MKTGGFNIKKTGLDANGNFSVWVSVDGKRARKIQTLGNLPITHRERAVNSQTMREISEYLGLSDYDKNPAPRISESSKITKSFIAGQVAHASGGGDTNYYKPGRYNKAEYDRGWDDAFDRKHKTGAYKENPAPRIGTARPHRKSQITKKRPEQRLIARRKKNSRKGYFPNPSKRVSVDEFKKAVNELLDGLDMNQAGADAYLRKQIDALGDWTGRALTVAQKRYVETVLEKNLRKPNPAPVKRTSKRTPLSAEWWTTEADYITGVNPSRPGENFNSDPATFQRYANMQRKFALADGATDAARRIGAVLRSVTYQENPAPSLIYRVEASETGKANTWVAVAVFRTLELAKEYAHRFAGHNPKLYVRVEN